MRSAVAEISPISPLRRTLRVLAHACGLDERRCVACHVPYSADSGLLCPECLAALQPVLDLGTRLCLHCGGILLAAGSPAVCGSCLTEPPPWGRMHVAGVHEGLLRDLLLRAKYKADRGVCRVLGELLAARLLADGTRADAIVPMPLHPDRLRHRGFNQCHELAAPVSARMGVPRLGLARRLAFSRPQTGLRREERMRNLLNSREPVFAADPAVQGLHVLILDDTMTTGATLRRLTACLLEAGASGVDAAVVAAAGPRGA